MIDSILEALRTEIANVAPLAVLFGVVAYVTKRDALVAAIRRARPEIVTNLVLLLVNALVVVPLIAVPILTGHSLLPRADALVSFWEGMPAAVSIIAAIALMEFAAYWRHRLEHVPMLWPVHATHHADEAMNWLSVRRKHPFGEALALLIDNLLVILLGLPFWAIGVGLLLRSWWGYFIHADVPWTLGIFGKVFISPAAHRLHHIRDEELMGSNYGNMLTLWDKVFGTFVDPAPYVNCETGIAEGTRDAVGELARPFEARYWRKPDPQPAEQAAG
ncbi:MAG: sterol desaturase family protein [Erythrobacter sp.]|uniref:sterol desaturase family protein n=1 Tax=Erythrobacter sp. TaxID=1042 RepID=UPI0025E17C30|nr:sterol desaturase family protein [Erythrobacter sp.]MCM0000185.1 sterol desaturase family protein [Erythrobacter sp.]